MPGEGGNRGGEGGLGKEAVDVGPGAMMVLLLCRYQRPAPCDAAAPLALRRDLPTLQRKFAQFADDNFGRHAKVEEETEEHIAGNAGKGVEIKGLHAAPRARRMRAAAAAAPKPLSILTTVTPAAQELSMPRRGARPLKAAP